MNIKKIALSESIASPLELCRTCGKSMREEILFIRDELARLREMDSTHDLERKRLMAMVEDKDEDISKMTGKIKQHIIYN